MIDIDEAAYERQFFLRRYFTIGERAIFDEYILEDRQDNNARMEQHHPTTCAYIDEEDL